MAEALSGPSLEKILSRHGLKRDHLECVCPRDVRIRVAVKLKDWKMVGYYFGFKNEELAAIDREYETEDQRKVALLDAWSAREGSGASCLKLADVLHERGRNDILELLCKSTKIPAAAESVVVYPGDRGLLNSHVTSTC